MQDFALVSEGPTDHPILKNILIGYFKTEEREPDINLEHPDPRADINKGGWTRVLEYLRTKKFRQALQLNRYLIVQVDTDVSEESGFDVPQQNESGPRTVSGIVEAVKLRLIQVIGTEDWQTYGNRFIFAVAVQQTECWVLPLWEDQDAKAAKTVNCLEALKKALQRKNRPWVQKGRKDKDLRFCLRRI